VNKDSNLEQLLRSLGQDSIERPSDLEAKTLERMHTSLPKTQGRDRAKYLGVLVAAALLLIGFLGTQSFLTWFSGPAPGTPGVDLSTDPRIRIISINGSPIIPTPDFISSFVNLAAGDIPHIKLGETIELDFAGDPPDSVQVLDHLLTEDGVIQYTAREVIERSVQLFEDKGSFPLERHHAASLSSQYPPPPSLRGFRVICSWGEEIREYAYVINADE